MDVLTWCLRDINTAVLASICKMYGNWGLASLMIVAYQWDDVAFILCFSTGLTAIGFSKTIRDFDRLEEKDS